MLVNRSVLHIQLEDNVPPFLATGYGAVSSRVRVIAAV